MKTTVDIPDKLLKDAMKYSKAKTKREAIVSALDEFTRRKKMAELVRFSGKSTTFMDSGELMRLRKMG